MSSKIFKIILFSFGIALLMSNLTSSWALDEIRVDECTAALLDWWNNSNWWCIPLIIGGSLSLLTWQTVYLDSNVPGIDPPVPFSSLHSLESKSVLHPGYSFAFIIGPVISLVLLLHGIS